MGQALYRKYRSRSWDEVVGQEHIIQTLRNALKSGRITHAYLFTGPKGVGKTSVARILAHEVNGLEYKDESIHLDIIEIDAASNRRIDEIRELRERVHIAPTSAKYKVYIIDEVHMLTREAFNALLKTLEEPPEHCIFILATTEAHKLPETIISRTQHFSFKPIESESAAERLKNVAKTEKIDIDPKALEMLAQHGGGSLRDSLSLLDQLGGKTGKIDEAEVRATIGLPPASRVEQLMRHISEGSSRDVLSSLDELRDQGVDAALLARAIGQNLRTILINGHADDWQIKLLRRLSRVAASANPQEQLEIDVLEAATSHITRPTVQTLRQTPPLEAPEEPAMLETNTESEPKPEKVPEALSEADISERSDQPASNVVSDFSLEMWPQVTAKAKTEAASLYTALRLAEPMLEGNKLILSFQFPLHQKKLAQAKNVQLLSKIIEEISSSRLSIEAVVDKTMQSKIKPRSPAPAPTSQEPPPSLQTINNIFGTAEVLES